LTERTRAPAAYGPVDALLMTVGVVGVSTSGPLVAACAAPVLAIAFWRTGLASLLSVPFLLARRAGSVLALRGRALWLTLLAGVLLAGHFATWLSSLRLTSVASSTSLVCMQAGWAVLFSFLLGERASRRVVLGLGIAFLGVLVVSGVDFSISTQALLGDLLALVGGMFSGAYVVLGGIVRRTTSTTVYTSVCYGACAGSLLAGCLVSGQALWGYAQADWAKILALTLLAQLLGHSVFNHLLATRSASVVSLVILLEVPGAALLAAVFLGQSPPLGVFVGLALVLTGVALVVSGTGSPAAPDRLP
jgi:drug/metabolite transporter (DMT)-like permease